MQMSNVKKTVLIMSGWVAMASYAYAQGPDPEPVPAPVLPSALTCTVDVTSPEDANFFWVSNIGPRPGDQIDIDLTKDEITDLTFRTPNGDANNFPHSVPLHRSGAKLTKVATEEEYIVRYEGTHRGPILQGDYLGQVLFLHNGDGNVRAIIDVLLLGRTGEGMTLHKSTMNCVEASN